MEKVKEKKRLANRIKVEIVVVKRHHKSSAFDDGQGNFVQSFGEKFLSALGPWDAVTGSQGRQFLLARLDSRHVIEDLLQRNFQLARTEQTALVVQGDLKIFAVAIDGDVSRIVQVDDAIRFDPGSSGRVEDAFVLK